MLLLIAAFAPPIEARTASGLPSVVPGRQIPVRAGYTTHRLRPILAPNVGLTNFSTAVGPSVVATANIQVTYHGFLAQAQAAFQAAVDVWQSAIVSSQVIHVDATWTSLGANSGILGQAGPTFFYLGDDNRYYPAALAEAICACDENSGAEIEAEFNSAFPSWYLGTDGLAGSKYDFTTVVIHELGHGLGFLSTFEVSSGQGRFGLGSQHRAVPFDDNEWSAASGGSLMTSFANPSSALKTELTDGSVYLAGSNVEAVLGQRAKLYAPSTWSGGSSNSHLDESAFPTGTANALMTPFLDNGEVIHDPGPATLAIFRDIGWTTSGDVTPIEPTEPGAPTNVGATPGNASATVSWSAPTSNGGSTINGYTVLSTPDSQACQTSGDTSCVVNGLTNGVQYTFTVSASNDVGSGPVSDSSNLVTPSDLPLDSTPPTVVPPTAAVIAGQQLGVLDSVLVSWPAASDDTGIAGYELQLKKGSGLWISVGLDAPTATSVAVALKPGSTYRFRVRATDGTSNVSDWATSPASRLRLVQENAVAMAYSGKWRRSTLSGASGAHVRYAGAAGRTATLTFSGTSVGFVSTLGPTRGIAQIWIDGQHVQDVDLYAPTMTTQMVVWAADATLADGTHTIAVVATGIRNPTSTQNRVDVDAFLTWP